MINKIISSNFLAKQQLFSKNLKKYFIKNYYSKRNINNRLFSAMNYSLFNGGKRIRPLLVLECANAIKPQNSFNKVLKNSLKAAIAVEFIHCYSLIHDDLPAIDNDNLRRNKPSCHKAFDEATAILAGDALLTDAFNIIATITNKNSNKMILELSKAVGGNGMVFGQMIDILEKTNMNKKNWYFICKKKTAELFSASCILGALSANATNQQVIILKKFGFFLGIAFQLLDDCLDKDSNLVKTLGINKVRQISKKMTQKAISQINFLKNNNNLYKLTLFATQK